VAAVDVRRQAFLATIRTQIDAFEREIADLKKQGHALTDSGHLLQSIKGIEAISAVCLPMASHDDTDSHAPDQVVAYAGTTLFKHESGTSIRCREQI
jgi:transposase